MASEKEGSASYKQAPYKESKPLPVGDKGSRVPVRVPHVSISSTKNTDAASNDHNRRPGPVRHSARTTSTKKG